MLIRYSRWDGSQAVPDLDADDLLSAMSDDLMLDGDPWRALRRLFQQGLQHPAGQRTPGLQDLLKQLRQQRQQRLDRYDLGGALEDIKKKLAEVIQTEREGIKDRLAGTSAEQKLAELDKLPPDPGGQIRELQTYDFVDPEAKRRFDELMQSLRAQMLAPLLKGMQQALQGMTPEDLRRLREMLQDLNRMLRQRAEGQEPDFQAFKDKWGQFFPGAESLDELLAQLGRGIAQMQSLLESMSPGQRGELQDMMRSLFMQDERLEAALAQLAGHLEEFLPLDELRRRYEFGGDEEVTLREAMKLMEELQGMDQLERQLRRAESPADLEQIDPAQVAELLGEEAVRDLEKLREIAKKLEEAGYLERRGDRLELTALAIRKIADKAPRDSLHIVGFSLYAREFTAEQLPTLTWTDWNVGTNMHAGFALSRQRLGRQKVGNKQIIMITDGEPTAHLEGNEAAFAYPPTRRTLQETLKEVQRCTREGITINTFMLDRSPTLTAFVREMARINRGRAFFAAPERLGEYVLVDYVRNKRRAVS